MGTTIMVAVITAVVFLWLGRSLSAGRVAALQEKITALDAVAATAATTITRLEQVEKDYYLGKEHLAQERQAVTSLREQLADKQTELQAERQKMQELRQGNSQLESAIAALKAEQAERDAGYQKQLQHFEEQKESLKKEFENLANRIFEERGKSLTQSSQASLDALLKPFREQITGFQNRINEVHRDSVQGNASIGAEIKKVLDVGLKMQEEANNLASALKGDSQVRGAWGEAQLEKTLEASGLVSGTHYSVQEHFRNSEGQGRRTDYIINLPDGKHIIIDSKTNVPDYARAMSAETADERASAMRDHVNAMKKHVDDLAKKDYTDIGDLGSPDFVLMFVPVEPAFIEALKFDGELFNYGYRKNVILVSHTTLIPILRTVANLWVLEKSNRVAKELGDNALGIYNQVCLVADRLASLGSQLDRAGKSYNETVTAMVGQQGLVGKVERFSEASTKAKKEMASLEQVKPVPDDARLRLQPVLVTPDDAGDTGMLPEA